MSTPRHAPTARADEASPADPDARSEETARRKTGARGARAAVACSREQHQTSAIVGLNLLLGWTVLGWALEILGMVSLAHAFS